MATALALVTLTGPVQAAAPPSDGAHPPHRVHGDATTSPTGYSPAQIRHAYGFDLLSQDGSGQIVGIVDAYDDPTAATDLRTFITTLGARNMNGLSSQSPCTVKDGPHPCFQKVYAQNKPRPDGSWALESSLDVQWAHAIAPGADILLVEARTNSFANLLGAVDVAVKDGSRAVSMSWGGSEFSSESSYDYHFNVAGVHFTASSGDNGNGVLYPSVSPYVVGVGGTTLPLDALGKPIGPESAWSGSGGGISAYEAEPGYQSNFSIPSDGGKRGVPDVAYEADPNTGVSVYDSTSYQGQTGWFQVGGTSAGSPQWAALAALADQGRGTSALSTNNLSSSPEYNAAELSVYSGNYRDITAGSNGTCGSVCTAGMGYDFVTGLGSPLANSLVPYLTTH
jgi:subtilase family serine protease